MGSLIPSSTFAGPTEPLWAPAGSGGGGSSGPTGPTGPAGPSGSRSTFIHVIEVPPGDTPYDFLIKPQYNGAYLPITTPTGEAGTYILNFVNPTDFPFPANGTFFIKNIDTGGNAIQIQYNGELRGLLWPPAVGTNGFFCMAQITGNITTQLKIY